MSSVLDKQYLTAEQLEALAVDFMLLTATNSLTEQHFDEIIKTFIEAEVPMENLIQTIAQGKPTWRLKYIKRFGGNAFNDLLPKSL